MQSTVLESDGIGKCARASITSDRLPSGILSRCNIWLVQIARRGVVLAVLWGCGLSDTFGVDPGVARDRKNVQEEESCLEGNNYSELTDAKFGEHHIDSNSHGSCPTGSVLDNMETVPTERRARIDKRPSCEYQSQSRTPWLPTHSLSNVQNSRLRIILHLRCYRTWTGHHKRSSHLIVDQSVSWVG